jgi:hypothetical protein
MDEFRRALLQLHSSDLPVIRRYVAWVRLRRQVQDAFYLRAHWVRPLARYHWVG